MCVRECPGEGQRGKNHQAGQVGARGRGAAMYRGDRFRARTEGSYQFADAAASADNRTGTRWTVTPQILTPSAKIAMVKGRADTNVENDRQETATQTENTEHRGDVSRNKNQNQTLT
jgi:hypothetical protein